MRKSLLLIFIIFSILSVNIFASASMKNIRVDKQDDFKSKSTSSASIEKELKRDKNITSLIKPKFGIYITSLNELNPKGSSFDVIFWTWFLHNTKNYTPEKTVDVTNIKDIQSFYELDAEEKETTENNSDSKIWNTQKFKATILQRL